MNAPDSNDSKEKKSECSGNMAALMWWTTLVMAVIAVPLIGGLVALASTESSLFQMVLFVLTCWVCIWLGMWLVRKTGS